MEFKELLVLSLGELEAVCHDIVEEVKRVVHGLVQNVVPACLPNPNSKVATWHRQVERLAHSGNVYLLSTVIGQLGEADGDRRARGLFRRELVHLDLRCFGQVRQGLWRIGRATDGVLGQGGNEQGHEKEQGLKLGHGCTSLRPGVFGDVGLLEELVGYGRYLYQGVKTMALIFISKFYRLKLNLMEGIKRVNALEVTACFSQWIRNSTQKPSLSS